MTVESGFARSDSVCSGTLPPRALTAPASTTVTLTAANSSVPARAPGGAAAAAALAGRPMQSTMHPGLTLRMSLDADCSPLRRTSVSPMIICTLCVRAPL